MLICDTWFFSDKSEPCRRRMDEEIFPLQNNSLVSETEDQHEVDFDLYLRAFLEHIYREYISRAYIENIFVHQKKIFFVCK